MQKGKVWIISGQKTDGRYNQGLIVGHEMIYEPLSFHTAKQYLDGFKEWRYKVAYVDCVTGRGCCEWFHRNEISKTKPEFIIK